MSRSVKNLLVVGSATLSRLIGTLVLYAVLARMLGPENFGEFVFWNSLGILLGGLSDYGFGQQMLIQLPVEEGEGLKQRASEILYAKLILVFVLFAPAIFFALMYSNSMYSFAWIALTLLGGAFGTMVEFFGIMLRSRQLYAAEAVRTFFATFVASISGAIVATYSENLVTVGAVMLFVRAIILLYQYRSARTALNFEFGDSNYLSFRKIKTIFSDGFSYALDGAAGQLMANIDLMLAKIFLTPAAAGIYMAGNRLLFASIAGIPVLSNIFVPQMMVAKNVENNIRTPKLLLAAVIGVSAFVVLAFSSFPKEISVLLFGDSFGNLSEMMPIIGIVVAVRYLSGVDGMILSVAKKQIFRARVIFVSALVFAVAVAAIDNFLKFTPYILFCMVLLTWLVISAAFRYKAYAISRPI